MNTKPGSAASTIKLTGSTAFQYTLATLSGENKAIALLKAAVGFFAGRKITTTHAMNFVEQNLSANPELSMKIKAALPPGTSLKSRITTLNPPKNLLTQTDSHPVEPDTSLDDRSVHLRQAVRELIKEAKQDSNHPLHASATVPEPPNAHDDHLKYKQRMEMQRNKEIEEEKELLDEAHKLFDTPPPPVSEETLNTLGLTDHSFEECIHWLENDGFVEATRSHRSEVTGLVENLIHQAVHSGNASAFTDLCAILGSKAKSKWFIPTKYESLHKAFVHHSHQLLSKDQKASTEACRIIGMHLTKALSSYLEKVSEGANQNDSHDSAIAMAREMNPSYTPPPLPRWIDIDALKKYKSHIGENELIDISHGGGRYHINRFLDKKTEGYYQLETGHVKGLAVHPGTEKIDLSGQEQEREQREKLHAEQAYAFLDLPARLTARIPAQQVRAAKHTYEGAIITTDQIDYLEESSVSLFVQNSEAP